MKIKLIIASGDGDYTEHLSRVLADRYADVFEVGVCSTQAQWAETLKSGCDAALVEPAFAQSCDLKGVRLPLLLRDESSEGFPGAGELRQVEKYQRISSIAGAVLEGYAQFSSGMTDLRKKRGQVTAVWSPAGGTGKTTVALAYAARKASDGRHATYLSLENFCSAPAYFPDCDHERKSISTVFEKLEADVPMLLKGILQQDSGSGIAYYCGPNNYDDMNILTGEDLDALIRGCVANTEELVVDLSAQCDEKTRKIFELADTVLIVSDGTPAAQAKLLQFMGQHNIAQQIRDKSVLINNRGAKAAVDGLPRAVELPYVRTADIVSVYKTLSGSAFEW